MKTEEYFIDIIKEVNTKNINTINSYIYNIAFSFLELFKKKNENHITKQLSNSRDQIKELIYDLDLDNEDILKSYTYGRLSMILMMLDAQNKSDYTIKTNEKNYVNNQYLYKILELIDRNGYIGNLELINELRISKNNLSNIINRLEKLNYFTIRKLSNKKYYFITYEGKQFLDYFKFKQPRYARIVFDSVLLKDNIDNRYINDPDIKEAKIFELDYNSDKSYRIFGGV